MKIAIIDSGVDKQHEKLINAKISGFSVLVNESNDIRISDEFHDIIGHGTAITSIIYKHYPESEFIIIKIFLDKYTININALYKALEWCGTNDVNIINLSLGMINYSPTKLYNLCLNLYNQNKVIISAASNIGKEEAFPAYFPFTYGVTSGDSSKSNEFGYLKNSPVEFLAKGVIQRVAWNNNSYKVLQGTSYACAHFTGIVAKYKYNNKSLNIENLKKQLIAENNNKIRPLLGLNRYNNIQYKITNTSIEEMKKNLLDFESKYSWIGKCAVFPTSDKELSVFTKFPNASNFEVTLLLDYPRQTNIKNNSDINNIKFNLPSNEELLKVDTFVIGYYIDQLFELNLKHGHKIVSIAIKSNKNIFYLDPRLKEVIDNLKREHNYKGKTYCPNISEKTLSNVQVSLGIPSVEIPVLAVVGTSSKQGKFTTQLKINQILKENGYKVGFYSTEPHGELFGANFVFPYGYLSNIDLCLTKWPSFNDFILRQIQEYLKPHIITTGIQSSMIFRNHESNEAFGGVYKSWLFLSSVKPDAFICCVNPDDSLDDIGCTVQLTKIMTKGKFLFFVLYPFKRVDENGNKINKRISEQEYNTIKNNIIHTFNSPVINIMDNEENIILKSIEHAFTNESEDNE